MPQQTRIVSPGPDDRVVIVANGATLKVPSGWELLPPGDATLTRRVKAAGPTWTVQEKKGRRVFSLGVWASAAQIAAVRQQLTSDRSSEDYARRRNSDSVRRKRQQEVYVEDFRLAILKFLAFSPSHASLAERLADEVTAHAAPVGSGTVARTQRIPIEQRAESAVIAWLRHQTTAYDHMEIPRVKGRRREVRRQLAAESRQLLARYRSDDALPDSVCPLQSALSKAPAQSPESSGRGSKTGDAPKKTSPRTPLSGPRLGLCCTFRDEPIAFRTTTAAAAARVTRRERLAKLASLCRDNAQSLQAALEYCQRHAIGCFRINSQVLPLRTHPEFGYQLSDLPDGAEIELAYRRAGEFAERFGIRTSFHPDQFVVLNSPREDVVARSILELEYQAEVAEWVGADVVNIHGGGGYGDKRAALQRFANHLERLSLRVRTRLTVENDDKTYTPSELLPLCRETGVPLVYDVHHHRCLPDDLSVEQATSAALATWDREPLFHISSPRDGWGGKAPQRHHDYIDASDFPECWRMLDVTIEVEAKAKELAVQQLVAQVAGLRG